MKIFCSGIGGIGLSAYASLQNAAGHQVYGSDRSQSALLDDLASQGITVSTDQSGTAIPDGCELLVYSEAIPADAPERAKAQERGIPQQSYPQALGAMSSGYKVIAVCGTHGKSSTTAMCARLLTEAGLDPTIVVGTKLKELSGRNWRQGKSDLFLLEACEYRRSFGFYTPYYILMTNADGDHFDYYESEEDYQRAFTDFIALLPKEGALITHMNDAVCKRLADESGKTTIDADTQPMIELKTPGKHMQQNARLALALAEKMGIDPAKAHSSVGGYAGSWRRMEVKGTFQGALVIDDYAHHPAEIKATTEAIRDAYPGKRLVCLFQPHTHDRTIKLYKELVHAFTDADLLLITDVYEARKTESGKVNMARLVGDISRESGVPTGWTGTLAATKDRLKEEIKEGDVLLCMGAGDITNLASELVKQ